MHRLHCDHHGRVVGGMGSLVAAPSERAGGWAAMIRDPTAADGSILTGHALLGERGTGAALQLSGLQAAVVSQGGTAPTAGEGLLNDTDPPQSARQTSGLLVLMRRKTFMRGALTTFALIATPEPILCMACLCLRRNHSDSLSFPLSVH